MQDIKSYRPETNSLSTGQVLQEPYTYEKAKLITMEMTDLLVLDIVEKGLVTNQLVLTIIYDTENLKNPEISRKYHGEITTDAYGRKIPKNAHGSKTLDRQTSSTTWKILRLGCLSNEPRQRTAQNSNHGNNLSGKATYGERSLIKGFDESKFDVSGFEDGVTVKALIEVDAVQFNRYPQLWNIDKLPWK